MTPKRTHKSVNYGRIFEATPPQEVEMSMDKKRDMAREKAEKATKDKGKVEVAAYRRSVGKPMKAKKK